MRFILKYNSFLFSFSRKSTSPVRILLVGRKRFEVVSQQNGEVLSTIQYTFREGCLEVACAVEELSYNLMNVSVLLTAGLKTSLLNKKLGEPSTFQPTVTAWRNGEFYFDNSSLSQVLTTLELQYDVKIYFDGPTDRSYTGYFTANNLEESLKLVCLPLALEYQILSKKEIKLFSKINY
jgi:ferric-dicitrate binding protein FerR (iron transport regulator)